MKADNLCNKLTSDKNVLSLPLTIDGSNVLDGVLEIVKNIKPLWNIEYVQLKPFTEGCTNQLIGCFYNPLTSENSSISSDDTANVFLVRVYGNNTEVLIDRNEEIKNIILLHSFGFAPELFATFNNGIAYEYSLGEQVTKSKIYEDKVWQQVAKRMAELHRDVKKDDQLNVEPFCWIKIRQFLSLIPTIYNNASTNAKRCALLPSNEMLQSEFNQLYNVLSNTASPVVFAHNDLLLGNIIYDDINEKITFIDYEYAACNYQAFDIGNHFAEFAGMTDIDYTRYPSREFQINWLRVYLTNYHKYDGKTISDEYIRLVYADVNKFALISHFMWAIWGLIQAEHSSIDYDFIEFSNTRYTEYVKRKNEFLAY